MRRFEPRRLGRWVALGIGLLLVLGGLQAPAVVWGQGSGQNGEEETGPPNLSIESIQLLVRNEPTFFLESLGQPVTINATIRNDGDGPAESFDVDIRFRREDEATFREEDLCLLVGSTGRCENLSLAAGSSTSAIGVLNTGDLTPGRYIIEVSIDPAGTATSPEDDVQETLLLIGITTPEYHPTSISFSPPSPITVDTPLTVRVAIENTGRPESPELEVVFEHCIEAPVCTEWRSRGFEDDGVKRLDPDETRALEQGRPLTVTNRLDTSDLSTGHYRFRVTVRPIGDERELDRNNNRMTTSFTIATSGGFTGSNPPQCQLTGDVFTLGKGVGTLQTENRSRSVEVIYVGTRTESGQVSLHALTRESFDNPNDDGTCTELPGSPFPLQADISSFILDQDLKLLFVGLTNGQLVVVDVDRADTLSATSRRVTSTSLNALDMRLTGQRSGQLFAGVDGQRLFRLSLTKDTEGNIVFSSQDTCASTNGPLKQVQIFQGNVYFTAGNTLRRMDESRCNGSSTSLFTTSTEIQTFGIGQLTFGITRSPRMLIGTVGGNVHVLNIFGQELADSPIELDSAVTSMAIDDGERATEARGETSYVGTGAGAIHAIDLRGLFNRCSFQTPSQETINTIAVDDGSGGLPDRGFVFIGSSDSQLYVTDPNCNETQSPTSAAGSIRAQPLVDAEQGVLGPTGLTAIFGGGNGLFELSISL